MGRGKHCGTIAKSLHACREISNLLGSLTMNISTKDERPIYRNSKLRLPNTRNLELFAANILLDGGFKFS